MKKTFLWIVIFAAAMGIHVFIHVELAGKEHIEWRPVYDIVMKWINFGILAFLIVRYVKTPIMNFLNNQKEEISRNISRIEEKKKKTVADLKETQKLIAEGEARIKKIKQKITEQGESEKEKIIQEAHEQSAYMIEESKRMIGFRIVQAKEMFRAELVDAAIAVAKDRLPKEITDEDNERFFNSFLSSMTK